VISEEMCGTVKHVCVFPGW